MIRGNGSGVAGTLLRLLLDADAVAPRPEEWAPVCRLAERDRLVLRLGSSLARRGIPPPPCLARSAEAARAHALRVHALVERIARTCDAQGIAHVFLGLHASHPDVGRDVDMLVGDSSRIDELILDHVPAVTTRRTLGSRLTGTTSYPVPECHTVIDVRHGRLGRLGEHARYATLVLRRRRRAVIGGVACHVPSMDDELLLAAVGQFARWPSLRVRDVCRTVQVVRSGRSNWGAVITVARAMGLLPGLSGHLDHVEQVHLEVFGRPLLDPAVRSELLRRPWGTVRYSEGCYRSTARVSGRIYVERLLADLRTGDWPAAGRVLLLPIVVASAGWRRLAHSDSRGT